MHGIRFALPAALTVALGLALAGAQSTSAAGGGYSSAQAAAGGSTFNAKCSFCHTLNLSGGAGPALSGPTFHADLMKKYKTAGSLYTFISKKMPLDSPGSLGSANYLAVTAFLLSKNGYPAGSAPLTVKSAASVSLTH